MVGYIYSWHEIGMHEIFMRVGETWFWYG